MERSVYEECLLMSAKDLLLDEISSVEISLPARDLR